MIEYLKTILKPFNLISFNNFTFMNFKADVSIILSSFITILISFSEHYLGISGVFAVVLLVLIITDFITGVIAARLNKVKLTSKKGLKTLYKTGAYIIFIYASFNLKKEVGEEALFFTTVLKYFHIFLLVHISFWELFSIDENLKKIGVDLGMSNFLKTTYDGIKKIFSNITSKDKKDLNE